MFGFDIKTLDDAVELVSAIHRGNIISVILLSIIVGIGVVLYSFIFDDNADRKIAKITVTVVTILLIATASASMGRYAMKEDTAYIEKTFNEAVFKCKELKDKQGNVYVGEVAYIEYAITKDPKEWYSLYVDKNENVVAIENKYGKIEINKNLQRNQVEALRTWNSYKMSFDLIAE